MGFRAITTDLKGLYHLSFYAYMFPVDNSVVCQGATDYVQVEIRDSSDTLINSITKRLADFEGSQKWKQFTVTFPDKTDTTHVMRKIFVSFISHRDNTD